MTSKTFDFGRASFPEIGSIAYLTGVSTAQTREAGRQDLGLLATPASSVHRQRGCYDIWAADNGCFNERHPEKGQPFDEARWLRWLADCGPAGCVFVTLPDVLNWIAAIGPDGEQARNAKSGKLEWIPVGDAKATWERGERLIDRVKEMGFPVAMVLQDGIEDLPEIWEQILERCDAIFIGGSDAFKLGPAAARLAGEAKARGLWVHVGRVSSWKRMEICIAMDADSADGTYIGFGPSKNFPKVIEWLDRARSMQAPEPEPFAAEMAA